MWTSHIVLTPSLRRDPIGPEQPFQLMRATLHLLATFLVSGLSFSASGVELQIDLPQRGPHHGIVSTGTGAYVVVANGMHYLEAGEWKDSDPSIDLELNGAVALRLPHKLLFGQ